MRKQEEPQKKKPTIPGFWQVRLPGNRRHKEDQGAENDLGDMGVDIKLMAWAEPGNQNV